MCEAEGIEETVNIKQKLDKKTLEIAVEDYISEYSDTLKSIYDTAIRVRNKRRYESPQEILNAILSYTKKDSVTVHEVTSAIQKKYKDYKSNNLKKYLDELTTIDRGEILRYDKDSYTYHFSNPFLRAYVQCIKNNVSESEFISKAQLLDDLKSTLTKELEIARQAFKEDFDNDYF